MIKKVGIFEKFVLILALLLFITAFSFGTPAPVSPDSEIWFDLSDLTGGRWQYEYTVKNFGF